MRHLFNQAEEKRLRAIACERAKILWELAEDAPHPYLDKKGVCSCGARVFDGKLVIPVTTIYGEFTSAQFIYPDGFKKFLRGGEVDGMLRWMPSLGDSMLVSAERILICEGWATGATLFAAMGGQYTVCLSFSARNLSSIAKKVRNEFPSSTIVICADNDHGKPSNPGLDFAFKAAKESDAVVIAPMGINGTDFNDMQAEKGIFYVEDYIKEMLNGKAKGDQRNKRRRVVNSR